MGSLTDFERAVAVVVAIGAIGAFIDFIIGKEGQNRVKSFLEEWWIRVSYVRINNFGYQEALLAVGVIDRLAGRRLLSWRRLGSMVTVGVLSIFLCALALANIAWFAGSWRWAYGLVPVQLRLSQLITSLAFFALSMSATRWLTWQASKLLGLSPVRNFIYIVMAVMFQYVALCYWVPVVDIGIRYYSTLRGEILPRNPIEKVSSDLQYNFVAYELGTTSLSPVVQYRQLVEAVTGPDLSRFGFKRDFASGEPGSYYILTGVNVFRVTYVVGVFANLSRLLLISVFLLSYLFRPLMKPVMLVWARLVEADKPMFTILFGGMAAIAKFTGELIKNL